MQRYQDRPIAQKLVAITLATAAVALLLGGIGNVLIDALLFRGYLRRDLTVLARVIADNSTAAISFNDPGAATQTLAALKERSHVRGGCIYRDAGRDEDPFATYGSSSDFSCPQLSAAGAGRPPGEQLALKEPILLEGRQIGTLVLYYDLGELNERVRLYGSIIAGVFFVATLLSFLLSSHLRRSIAAPIAALVQAMTKIIESGDYSVRTEKLSGDELGVLVDRFNEMLARTQNAFHEVEAERARFEFMAESMPQKIFTATPAGDIDYFNPQWMEYTGLTFEQIKDWGWTQFVHPDDVEATVREWKRAVESGEPFHFQHRFRNAAGTYRWHLSRARAMRDQSGKITMWIGSNTDIHEQKETEEELRRANEDLQQFAYSASHDLQEPIRNVAVYSEVIARRYEQILDSEGHQFLEFLREGGQRLATLVNDLLAYTRASMAELREESVSASQALNNSLKALDSAIREANAMVSIGELPEVHMDGVHLQQVFQNLIGNAIKYRADATPQIHISAQPADRAWCFSVRDNGIGIDPEYKEKIFGVFKRLSHDPKYSGTGIGLAICQRVVERYGGRIWVESEPGKGSTFRFTVPQRVPLVRPAAVQSSGG